MTSPNWGLLQGNNALANFQLGVGLGQNFQDRRDAREQQNALLDLRTRQEDRLERDYQTQQASNQETQTRQRLKDLAKLFEGVTPENYSQRVAIAQRFGMDSEGIPPAYDPAWVQEQGQIAAFFAERPEALSNAAKQAQDMGFEPGTAEYEQTVRQLIEASLAKPYIDQTGATRLYTPQIGGPGQVQGAVPFDPNEWEVVEEGGGVGNGTGGFPGY